MLLYVITLLFCLPVILPLKEILALMIIANEEPSLVG